MLTLFEHPLSPYAQKNKIALREKDIEFELATPDAIGSGDTGGEFLKANPRGEVPALIDDGFAIFDSTIILEYLEDKWPTPALLPENPTDRARVRMIEDVMDTHFEAINWGLGEVAYFKRAEGAQAEAIFAKAARQTQGFFAWLEDQLGDADWFNGETFGWGDLSVIPYINGSASFGNTPPIGSNLEAWAARTNARTAVAQTAKEAAASIEGMTMVADVVEQGLFKREYRDHRLEWMVKTAGLDVVAKGLDKNNIRFSNDFS
ncbi:MAG: glutathione S-transferase family protein [Parvibaculaceae bacterium]|nr:glutathione S-transferase family protein [Parvibaculaceae bacterium]